MGGEKRQSNHSPFRVFILSCFRDGICSSRNILRPDRGRKDYPMDLKLACADFAFPLLPHDRVLDLIAMLEFQGVDIGLFEGRSHLWPSKVFVSPAKSG